MTPARKFVARLKNSDKIQLIHDFEQFERDGFIDECLLRQQTRKFIDEIGASGEVVVLFMSILALECYRHFTHRYFNEVAAAEGLERILEQDENKE